jgi:polyhydroxyalkanoate synthesis regulator phasin
MEEELMATNGSANEATDKTKATAETLKSGAHKATDLWYQAWQQAVQMASWTGNQTERFMHTLIDQGKVSQEDMLKLQQELTDQAKTSQVEFARITREAVDEAVKAYRQMSEQQLSALTEQVEELSRRMDEMRERLERSAT